MPAQILHTLFGEDLIAEIYRRLHPYFGIVAEKALEKIREHYGNAFALGCQGPDIFYHNQKTRPVALEYGTLLHRRGFGIFTAALLKMGLPDPPPDAGDVLAHRREKGINALGAYALGFMSHAILDRCAHPYIVYKSEDLTGSQGLPRGGAHAFLERIIDVLMLEHLRGTSSWDQSVLTAVCAAPPLGLKELLARALTAAYPERAGKDAKLLLRIDNTFRDCALFYRLTDPAHEAEAVGLSIPVIYRHPKRLPTGIDYLNLGHGIWYYPTAEGPEDRRSFPELYAAAVNTAADALSPCIASYLETGVFPIKDAAQCIGNGGLSIQDETGRPCAITRSDPLPLGHVLAWIRVVAAPPLTISGSLY